MISLSRNARTLKSEKLTFYNRSHDPEIRVYDEAGNVIPAHEHKGDFKECSSIYSHPIALAAKPNFSWTYLLKL
jgi:hypothetical protein